MSQIDVSGLKEKFPESWLLILVNEWDEAGLPIGGSLLMELTSREQSEDAIQIARELAPDFEFRLVFTGDGDQVETTKFMTAENMLQNIKLEAQKTKAISEAINAVSDLNLPQSPSKVSYFSFKCYLFLSSNIGYVNAFFIFMHFHNFNIS